MHSEDAVLQTTMILNSAYVKSPDTSGKSFTGPAYSISCKGGKSGLIMKETSCKNNLNFVKDVVP
jgi:hypothetical protein